MHFQNRSRWALAAVAALPLAVTSLMASASSHREAPFLTEHPKVDGTDFYMFRSYESGRAGYVTLIANYLPLQDSYGGPNYFTLDPEAVYDIHVDNDGDAREDLTFRFRFKNEIQDISLTVGSMGSTQTVPVPVGHDGAGRHRPRHSRSHRTERDRDVHRRAHSRQPSQLRQAAHERRGRNESGGVHEARRQRGPEVDRGLRGLRGEPRLQRRDSGLPAGPDVRRPAQGAVLGEPRRGVRSREHERRRAAGRRAQHHRRQEHHLADSRGAGRLPHGEQRARDRRLDDREPAADQGAEPEPALRRELAAARTPPSKAVRSCRSRGSAIRS